MYIGRLGTNLLIVTVLCLVVAWVTVGARCYVRIRLAKSFGTDDGLLVTSLVSASVRTYSGIQGRGETNIPT